MSSVIRAHALAWLALVLMVGLALWPLPSVLIGGDQVVGHQLGDLADHYWGTWWFGHELLSGRWPNRTDLVHFPDTVSLWYVDPVGGLLGALMWPLGFPRVYDAVVLAQALFGAFAAYFVGFDWTRNRAAALASGVVVGASPYLIGLAHSGLAEYIGLGLPVLACWAIVRVMGLGPEPARPRDALLAGALLAGCALQAFYYAAFGLLMLGCALPGPGWRARVRPAILTGLVFGVLAAPIFLLAWSTLSSPEAAVTTANAPGWTYKQLPATDLLTFFRWGEHYFPDTRADNPGILHVNHVGLLAIGLAALGFWRGSGSGRRLLVMGLVYFVFALGPRLAVDGQLMRWGTGAVPLPLAMLYLPGSPFRFVHHPYRMVAFLLPVLAPLAALGVARLPRWLSLFAAPLIVAESLLLSPAPWPLATTDVSAPAVYDHVAPGPVLDWPPDATTWNRSYAIWQVSHGRAIAYGVNTFLPEKVRSDALIYPLLRELRAPERRARNRDVPFDGQIFVTPADTSSHLYELGFRALVVHREALSEGEWRGTHAALIRALGEPEYEDAATVGWNLLNPNSTF